MAKKGASKIRLSQRCTNVGSIVNPCKPMQTVTFVLDSWCVLIVKSQDPRLWQRALVPSELRELRARLFAQSHRGTEKKKIEMCQYVLMPICVPHVGVFCWMFFGSDVFENLQLLRDGLGISQVDRNIERLGGC